MFPKSLAGVGYKWLVLPKEAMALFGTSGIRDLAPGRVSPRLALLLGELLGAKSKPWLNFPPAPMSGPVTVGFDGRRSGFALKAAVAAGAASAGADVDDLGLCATPTLALHAQERRGWGVMVTASHNPPQYNGLKVFWRGQETPAEWEHKIEEHLLDRLSESGQSGPLDRHQHRPGQRDWSSAGSINEAGPQAAAAHLRLLLKSVDVRLIRRRRPRVVVDCANASACALMPDALRAAGCRVEVLNGTPGEPYGRVLEPQKKTLRALGRAVRRLHADLGIAHDGDADRAVVTDEKGRVLGLDEQLALVVSETLGGQKTKKGAKSPLVISTVESSLSLREMVSSYSGRLSITPVGSRHVAAHLRADGAVFGGEPCGEYVFARGVGVPDGLMAGLFFVELFCRRGKLSKQAAAIGVYPMHRQKIPCANERKAAAMARIEKDWPFFKPSRVDGLRSDLANGWVLVRPSGTEPYMRLTAEARTSAELKKLVGVVGRIVERAVK